MSSTSKASLCRKCGELAVERVKPLVQCVVCKRKWHPICHRPVIETRFGEPVTSDWRCQRCQDKLKATRANLSGSLEPDISTMSKASSIGPANNQSAAYQTTGRVAGDSFNFSPAASFTEQPVGSEKVFPEYFRGSDESFASVYSRLNCEEIGCTRPVVHKSGIDNWKAGAKLSYLCKQHEMEEQHKRASAQRTHSSRQNGLSPVRPFNKKKLYRKSASARQAELMDDDVNQMGYEGTPSNASGVDSRGAYGVFHVDGSIQATNNLVTNASEVSTINTRTSQSQPIRKTNVAVSPRVPPLPSTSGQLSTVGKDRSQQQETSKQIEPFSRAVCDLNSNTFYQHLMLNSAGDLWDDEDRKDIQELWREVRDERRAGSDYTTCATHVALLTGENEERNELARGDQTACDEAGRCLTVPGLAAASQPSDAESTRLSFPTTNQPNLADDQYSPSCQLESEFKASGATVDSSPSALTSLATTPEEDSGVRSATFRNEDTEMYDVGDEIPAGQQPENQSLSYLSSGNGPQRMKDQTLGATERNKKKNMRILSESWGEDFHTKLSAWPDPPGKTFLEHLIQLCKVEKITFDNFKQGITAVFTERTAGGESSKSKRWDHCIKISDVKEFLARYQQQCEASMAQNEIINSTALEGSMATNSSQKTTIEATNDNQKTAIAATNNSQKTTIEPATDRITHVNDFYQPPEGTSCVKMPPVPGRFRRGQQVSSIAETEIDEGLPTQSVEEPSTPANNIPRSRLKFDFTPKKPGSTRVLGTPQQERRQQPGMEADPVTTSPDEPIMSTAAANSLEAKRQQKVAAFDESALDSFLNRGQTVGVDDSAWGHIDPRIAWPKDPTLGEDFLAAKRAEIEARGGRKSAARYGKALTPEVIKHRKEMGWQKHQNKEASEKWMTGEGGDHLEELFGVPDPATLQPLMKDGKLVMSEKKVDENGKQRRKAAIRTWPVLSAS